MTKDEFIEYLENTLIPDLRRSGSYATAEDFKAAVAFLKGAEEYHFSVHNHRR